MSEWTYVRGVVYLNVIGVTQEQKDYILKTVLNHLPVVSGSESDMVWNVAPVGAYYSSVYSDDRGIERKVETRSEYAVTLHGNLRDRDYETTLREFMKWLMRLVRRFPFGVDDAIVVISDKCWAFGKLTDHIIHLTGDDFRKCFCEDDYDKQDVFEDCCLDWDKVRARCGFPVFPNP